MSTEDIYNVSKYSDQELFNILDLINPTDRELEAKINNLIWKYTNIGGESGDRLAEFFKDIYEHFFDIEEEVETETNNESTIENEEVKEEEEEQGAQQNTGEVEYTKPLDYAKGTINPLLQQTTKRLVSIDSQYRDDKSALSSDFTFNLSDPLRDVLNLKLYSVQIPYTWYTINNNYGSNFFFLKGNSSGINNGNHDFQISIPIGNYTAQELIAAVSLSLNNIKTNSDYSDTNFGSTDISYNYANSKASLHFDISKHFNENQYTLEFSEWTTPNNSDEKKKSVAGFLGFNKKQYSGYSITSNLTVLPLTTTNAFANEVNLSIYSLTETNNFLDIINYTGSLISDEYTTDTSNNFTILNNVRITLSLPTGTTYTRTELYNDLNQQLQNNENLLNISKIERKNITESLIIGTGFSHYELEIRLNRFKFNQIQNSKVCVIFPNDQSIWLGNKSAFVFDSSHNELNNIVSETLAQDNKIAITSDPKLRLTCIKTNFQVEENNYTIDISNNNYLISEFVTEINNKIIAKNQETKDVNNSLGVFKINNTFGFINANTDIYTFRLDLTKTFTEKNFHLDLSNNNVFSSTTWFSNNLILEFDNTTTNYITFSNTYFGEDDYDLSTIDLSNNSQIFFTIKADGNGYKVYRDQCFLKLLPKSSSGIQNTNNIIEIKTTTYEGMKSAANTLNFFQIDGGGQFRFYEFSSDFSLDLEDLQNDINAAISAFNTSNNDILSGTNCTIQLAGDQADVILTINYRTSLTQTDYTLEFTDNFSDVLYNYRQPEPEPEPEPQPEMIEDPEPAPEPEPEPQPEPEPEPEFIYIPPLNPEPEPEPEPQPMPEPEPEPEIDYWFESNSVWNKNLKLGQSLYVLSDSIYNSSDRSYSELTGVSELGSSVITLTPTNNKIYLRPVTDSGGEGIYTTDDANSLTIEIPYENSSGVGIQYTRDQLLAAINSAFNTTYTTGGFNLSLNTKISVFAQGANNFTKIRLNINKTYRAVDYRVVFYDPASFVIYKIGNNIVTNTTWDATLGWILGFRVSTEYYLSDFQSSYEAVYNPTSNVRSITGDNVVSISIYNYFMIILDDYNQNHLNDGVVTTAQKESNIKLPSYSVRSSTRANPATGDPLTSTVKKNGQQMTKNEIYAAQEILNASVVSPGDAVVSKANSLSGRTVQYYSSGPFAKNVFALIPLKISGLANNQIFVEFGGTLQNQQRNYFGPVNINRMTVKLMNDKGELVDLNGANWSFSFICEQLYQQKKI